MLGFLKDKIKKSISSFKETISDSREDKKKEIKKPVKKNVFRKVSEGITHKTLSEKEFDNVFEELEMGLLQSNVAFEVIEKIKSDLKKELLGNSIKRSNINEFIIDSLRKSISDILIEMSPESVINQIKINKKLGKPTSFLFIGINGVGKTSTIAKIANYFKKKGFSVVLSASDTFRAASIEQLEVHAKALKVKLIKHSYGADPAAVAFDAMKHAESKECDAVLIDTAGRSHSNKNLMEEVSKIFRVVKPDFTFFVGEALTGNDAVNQAVNFNNAVGIDACILTKADVDAKGGALLSISYITKKPIIFLGVGQTYKDLKPFKKQEILKNLGLTKN